MRIYKFALGNLLLVSIGLLGGLWMYTNNTSVRRGKTSVSTDRPLFSNKTRGLGLYIRTFHKKKYLYDTVLLKSLQYFWPDRQIPLIVVLDDESEEDHKYGKEIAGRYPYPRVLYEKPVETRIYGGYGHYRQQRNMFYAEKFTDYEYIGFMDTDTFFVTPVTDDLLFENGKPIVIGQYGKASDFFWAEVGHGIDIMFKEKEVMRCMSYFRVIIKVEHLPKLRKYVEDLHKQPFDEVFRQSIVKYLGQFNMMCQYIWLFHRDEYSFHLQVRTLDGQWYGEGNSPFRQPYEYYQKIITPELTRPVPRSAIHYRYHKGFQNTTVYRNVLKEGLCHAGGFKMCPDMCRDFQESALQKPLYQFEASDWSWDERCSGAQRDHYRVVQQTMSPEHKHRIRMACREINSLTFDIKLAGK